MAAFERHVFICTNQREAGHPRGCCAAKDSGKIRERLKELVKQRGLAKKVRVNTAGCLDQCEHGVTIVVSPGAVGSVFGRWADVEKILKSLLMGGKPVERLRLPPGCINTELCPHK